MRGERHKEMLVGRLHSPTVRNGVELRLCTYTVVALAPMLDGTLLIEKAV